MSDIVLGLAGAALGFFLLLAGFVFGAVVGRKTSGEWIKRNGCYLCREAWDHGEDRGDGA